MTLWDCRTHVRMTSMTSSVKRTDFDFKISVALDWVVHIFNKDEDPDVSHALFYHQITCINDGNAEKGQTKLAYFISQNIH